MEHHLTDQNEQAQREGKFQKPERFQTGKALHAPNHQHRRDDEVADHIAEPPGQPRSRIVWREPAQLQRSHPEGGTDRRASQGNQRHKNRNIAHALERVTAPAQAIQQPAAGECFQGVAQRDAEGSGDGAGGAEVHQKGSGENPGPQSITHEHDPRQRETGRRPDR